MARRYIKTTYTNTDPYAGMLGIGHTCNTLNMEDVAEIEMCVQGWLQDVTSGKPHRMNAHYTEEAIMLPTLRNQIHYTRKQRLRYFEMFLALPKISGHLIEQHIHVFGDFAVSGGIYAFTFEREGVLRTIPARFSFTYRKTRKGWKILTHHSSQMPESPSSE